MADKSFLPEDYLEKRMQRRTNALCVALFVVVMVGVVGAFFATGSQRSAVQALQAEVNAEFLEAAQRLEQLDKLQQQRQEMVRKAEITATLLERVPSSLVLAELINNMPPTLSLLEVFADSKQVDVAVRPQTAMQQARATKAAAKTEPQVIPTEVTLVLVGLAPTDVEVAQYLSALGRSTMFTGVDLKFSEETKVDERVMRRFRVEFKIPHDLDVRTLNPTTVARQLKQNPMDDAAPMIAPNLESNILPAGDR